jgi:predicted nuclease with RNAse H fold
MNTLSGKILISTRVIKMQKCVLEAGTPVIINHPYAQCKNAMQATSRHSTQLEEAVILSYSIHSFTQTLEMN